MRISLKEEEQNKLIRCFKIYLLGIKDKKLVDKTFDKMYNQSHLKQTDKKISFSFLIFMVQKWVNKM